MSTRGSGICDECATGWPSWWRPAQVTDKPRSARSFGRSRMKKVDRMADKKASDRAAHGHHDHHHAEHEHAQHGPDSHCATKSAAAQVTSVPVAPPKDDVIYTCPMHP